MSDPGIPPPPPPPGGGAPPPPPPGGYGQPVRPVVAYANFGQRFLAVLIDGLILGVPSSVLQLAAGDDAGLSGLFSLIFLGIAIWYYGQLEGVQGQTLGKRAIGIRVVGVDTGMPVGFGRGVGRYFARILSAIPCFLGYLWHLWDPEKQTWHDKIVRTYVVVD